VERRRIDLTTTDERSEPVPLTGREAWLR